MKIRDIRLSILSVPLRVPFKTALRSVSSVEDVVVEILTDSGETGFGEAPPTGVITGDTTGAIAGAIRDHIAPKLIGRDIEEFETLLKDVQAALVHNTSAKAAVDIALWDLYGKHLGLSVFRLLGAARREIETDITISVNAAIKRAGTFFCLLEVYAATRKPTATSANSTTQIRLKSSMIRMKYS